jgi:hypothetical protein
MHLVSIKAPAAANHPPVVQDAHATFVGAALVVIFARAEEITRVREQGSGCVALEAPFHVSEEDTYLLLPDDIGEEIVDILRDGDAELVREAMRDGLCVQGQLGRNPRGRGMLLEAELLCTPARLLADGGKYAAELPVGGADCLRALNQLPHLQCTTLSALCDDEGLDQMLRAQPESIGCSWRPPASARRLQDIEPTYAWSRRLDERRVGVELALFGEDEELVAVLKPVCLTL